MVFAVAVFGILLGFMLGKWHERREWNLLIRRGVLPAPSPRRPADREA
jgi:hypothetical protein